MTIWRAAAFSSSIAVPTRRFAPSWAANWIECCRALPLRPISRSHAINTFLFRTSDPVVGENTVTMQNYGITRNGRLVVFYTMGNFSHLYASHPANELPYFAAQYQMGANVMLYAIRKGDNSGIAQHAGASAKITTEALQHLGMLEPTANAGTGQAAGIGEGETDPAAG